MNKETALKILIEHQAWRRWEGKYSEVWVLTWYTGEELWLAIDVVILELIK